MPLSSNALSVCQILWEGRDGFLLSFSRQSWVSCEENPIRWFWLSMVFKIKFLKNFLQPWVSCTNYYATGFRFYRIKAKRARKRGTGGRAELWINRRGSDPPPIPRPVTPSSSLSWKVSRWKFWSRRKPFEAAGGKWSYPTPILFEEGSQQCHGCDGVWE